MKTFDLKPQLFDTLKSYNKKTFMSDLMAGIIVGIVALPLAIAFGIASGVTPEKGIITAIVAGFLVSLLGGSKVQIGGPTGAFIVIIYGIIQKYGIEGLTIATIMAGVFLILFGLLKLGWDLPQMSACCIVIGAGTGIISGAGVNKTCDYMVDGCKDMMLGALMIGIARAVSVVMTQGQILDTIVHALAGVLNHLPAAFAIIGIFLVVTLLNFFIGSASGKAVALFPIISPLASVLGITQQCAVLAYQFGDGFTNYIWPTSGWMWGCLGEAGVSYQKWCKFYLPILAVFTVMACVFLIIAQMIQYGPF